MSNVSLGQYTGDAVKIKFKDRKDLRLYLMRRLRKDIHADLELLAYMLRRGKESVARECLAIGVEEVIKRNKIERPVAGSSPCMARPVENLVASSESSQHPDAKGLQLARRIIMQFPSRNRRYIKKSELTQKMSPRGYLGKQRNEFMHELVHVTKEVEVFQTDKGGIAYTWIGEVEEKVKE